MLHTAGSSIGHPLKKKKKKKITLSFHLCILSSFRRVVFVEISTKISCHCYVNFLLSAFSISLLLHIHTACTLHYQLLCMFVCIILRVSTSIVPNRILFLACQFPLTATLGGKTTGDELSSHAIRVMQETL